MTDISRTHVNRRGKQYVTNLFFHLASNQNASIASFQLMLNLLSNHKRLKWKLLNQGFDVGNTVLFAAPNDRLKIILDSLSDEKDKLELLHIKNRDGHNVWDKILSAADQQYLPSDKQDMIFGHFQLILNSLNKASQLKILLENPRVLRKIVSGTSPALTTLMDSFSADMKEGLIAIDIIYQDAPSNQRSIFKAKNPMTEKIAQLIKQLQTASTIDNIRFLLLNYLSNPINSHSPCKEKLLNALSDSTQSPGPHTHRDKLARLSTHWGIPVRLIEETRFSSLDDEEQRPLLGSLEMPPVV